MNVQKGITAYVYDSSAINPSFDIDEYKVLDVKHNTVVDIEVTIDKLDVDGNNTVFKLDNSEKDFNDICIASGRTGRFYIAFDAERIRMIILKCIDQYCDHIDEQKKPYLEAAENIKAYLSENIYYKEGDELYYSYATNYYNFTPRPAKISYITQTNHNPQTVTLIFNDGDKTFEIKDVVNNKHRVLKSKWRDTTNDLYLYVSDDPRKLIAMSRELFKEHIKPYNDAIEKCNKLLQSNDHELDV